MSSKNKAFTLVELLMVIAITGLLVTFGVPVYNQTQRRAEFNNVVSNLVSMINQARNRAFAGEQVFDLGQNIEVAPAGGYGLEVDSSSERVVLFADLTDNSSFDKDVIVEELMFPGGTEIKEIKEDAVVVNKTVFSFLLPMAKMRMNSGVSQVEIVIDSPSASLTKTITIEKIKGFVEMN